MIEIPKLGPNEDVDIAICGYTSNWPDDVWTICTNCHVEICHRPSMPPDVTKYCLRCGVTALARQRNGTLLRRLPDSDTDLQKKVH